jgi:hypothetical protein
MVKQTWQEVHGDETLALAWPIDSESLVWEIGGFEGRWAAQIVERFDPYMHIFEPQAWAYGRLNTRFVDNPKVSVSPFGLWTHDCVLRLWEHETDGASVMRHDGRTSEFCDFHDIMHSLTKPVDLCLMNIEGAEYVLIPHLIGLGLMQFFRFFWCQFHPGLVEFGKEKSDLIFSGMAATHKVLWSYFPTAVAWERK